MPNGDALKDGERHQEAAPCCGRAFQVRPDDRGPPVKRIDAPLLDARSGDIAGGAERLVWIFPRSAKSCVVRRIVGACCSKHYGPVGDFAAALKLDPDSAETLNCVGCSHAALGRRGDAVGMSERAARLRPGDPDAAYCLCRALEELGRYRDTPAVLDARRAVAGGNDCDAYGSMRRVPGL